MKSFLDTSVLIAAFLETHAGHEQALEILADSSPRDSFCSVHTLAELYSTLTRMPVRPMILPEQAAMYLENVGEHLSAVTLTAREYFATIRQAADGGLSGGVIYDALLLALARENPAPASYTRSTSNTSHVSRPTSPIGFRLFDDAASGYRI